LAANAPHVVIAAIVDPSPLPISTLASSPLLSLVELSKKYNCPHYTSVEDMLADPEVGQPLTRRTFKLEWHF
jgi:predicted dehydrogenase